MGKAQSLDLSRVSAVLARRIEWFAKGGATGQLTVTLHFQGGNVRVADFNTSYRMLPNEAVPPAIVDSLMGREDKAAAERHPATAVGGTP